MIEIDAADGSILWNAAIVDSEGESIEMWDLASNPHTIPEPSAATLIACGLMGLLTSRRRRSGN